VTAFDDIYLSDAYDQICGCGEQISRYFSGRRSRQASMQGYPNILIMSPKCLYDKSGVGHLLFSDFTPFQATYRILRLLRGQQVAWPASIWISRGAD